MTDPLLTDLTRTLADASSPLFLVSFWKPLILLVVVGGWAFVISKIYDKHAARFFLPREKWNLVHMICGMVGVLGALAVPMQGEISFWLGLGFLILVLMGDLVAYAVVANKDERVPEQFRIGLDIFTKMAEKKAAKKTAKQAGTVKLAIRGVDKQLVPPPAAETPEYEVRTAAEEVYITAMSNRASQVDVVPSGKDNTYSASMLVDGVRASGPSFPAPMAMKIIDLWKSAGKLDIADRRRKLTADITVEQGTVKHKVRLTSIGVPGGMRLTMLFDSDTAVIRNADELGLLESQMAELKAIVDDEKRGVVLIAGLPDGGRTTLLYSILRMHDAYTQSVQTVEMEPQAQLEGVRHQAFDASVEGADYGTTVRSMLRRDPDVLGVAEMPDANTAKELAKSDHERSRSYLCVKAGEPLEAVENFVKAVGDPAMAAKGLRGVICVRLMRKLCSNCKVGYPPAPDMLKKLGVTDGNKVQQLFKKGGQVLIKNKPEVCPVCSGGGYLGQEGVFEVYRFGDEERDLIAAGNMAGLKAAIRKRQLPTIQQAAVRKAVMGVTSVEEVQRALSGQQPAPAPAAPAPAAAGKAKAAAPSGR